MYTRTTVWHSFSFPNPLAGFHQLLAYLHCQDWMTCARCDLVSSISLSTYISAHTFLLSYQLSVCHLRNKAKKEEWVRRSRYAGVARRAHARTPERSIDIYTSKMPNGAQERRQKRNPFKTFWKKRGRREEKWSLVQMRYTLAHQVLIDLCWLAMASTRFDSYKAIGSSQKHFSVSFS